MRTTTFNVECKISESQEEIENLSSQLWKLHTNEKRIRRNAMRYQVFSMHSEFYKILNTNKFSSQCSMFMAKKCNQQM